MIAALLAQMAGATAEKVPPPAPETPPIDVFPYPLWMVGVAGVLGLLILGAVVFLIVRALKNRPGPPPPSARAIALAELEKLRARLREMDAYEFSVSVSNVLRTYISEAKFRLPATRQTSPEFLAAIADSPFFSEADRTLLAEFLERCDLIKFARIEAGPEESAALLESAVRFVQGERAMVMS